MRGREWMEEEIHQKEKRIAHWEKFRTVPKIAHPIKVLNRRTDSYGNGGIFGE